MIASILPFPLHPYIVTFSLSYYVRHTCSMANISFRKKLLTKRGKSPDNLFLQVRRVQWLIQCDPIFLSNQVIIPVGSTIFLKLCFGRASLTERGICETPITKVNNLSRSEYFIGPSLSVPYSSRQTTLLCLCKKIGSPCMRMEKKVSFCWWFNPGETTVIKTSFRHILT